MYINNLNIDTDDFVYIGYCDYYSFMFYCKKKLILIEKEEYNNMKLISYYLYEKKR